MWGIKPGARWRQHGTWSRRTAVVVVNALLFTLLPVYVAGGAVGDSYQLSVSSSANRSAPSNLDGATVSGNIYVFTSPDTPDISSVQFFLDGTLRRTEGNGPYDFAGGTVATANPFNTNTLTDGPHTITATINFAAGGGSQTITANFTIANNTATPTLAFSAANQSFTVAQDDTDSTTVNLTASSGTTAYTLTDNAPWLTTSPATGNTPNTITIDVNATGLTPGQYNATITASASGHTPDTLPVILNVTGTSTYQLSVSSSANRSAPSNLDGATVSGNIYVFTSPDTPDISSVQFFLDGTLRRTEGNGPYDFAGGTVATANPFNTNTLTDGPHTITATINFAAGGGSQTVTANFTIANNTISAPPDQVHLAWVENPSTSMTVVWRTQTSASNTIQYRATGSSTWIDAAGSIRPSGTTGILHQATVTGLSPGTTYEYRVPGDGSAVSEIFSTRTAPAQTTSGFEVVYVADTGLVGRTDGLATGTQQVIDEIAALDPHLVLGGGDYAYYNTDSRFTTLDDAIDAWFDQVEPFATRSPIMPTYGNHEILLGEGFQPWADRFPTPTGFNSRRFYSFDVGNAHFVSILSVADSQGLTDAQLDWVDQDMTAARAAGAEWIIPFFHAGPFADGSNHPSNTAIRAQFGPLFEEHDVELAIYSHDQSYERTYPLENVPTGNTPTSTSLTCYTEADGVVWLKTSPGGKLSSVNGAFSPFTTNPKPAWTAVRNNTHHHYTRLAFTPAGSLEVVTYGLTGNGSTPVVQDSFAITEDDCGTASTGTWSTTPADLAVGTLDAGYATIGPNLYMVGGKTTATNRITTTRRYDMSTDTWATLPNVPGVGREDLAVTAHQGRIYAFGGATANAFAGDATTAAVYDPGTNTWSDAAVADLPAGRSAAQAISWKGNIWILGGFDSGGASLSSVLLYNPATNTYSNGPSLPAARDTVRALVQSDGSADRLYVLGGRDAQGGAPLTKTTLWSLNASDTGWTTLASMPTARRSFVASAINGKVVVFGGENDSGVVGTVDQYDPVGDVWSTLTGDAWPTPRHGPVGGVYSSGGFTTTYLAGGATQTGSTTTAANDSFRVICTQACTQPTGYQLSVSSSANRSAPSNLDGATVSGNIYVFTSPDTPDISSVQFFLDGTLRRTEGNDPYDFAGGTVATANPFNTNTLTDGPHTITATINFAAGGGSQTLTANFTIANNTPVACLTSLPSSASPLDPPLSVGFASADGGLCDVGSDGTGFTWAAPTSNGSRYDRSRLDVTNGHLNVTTTGGLFDLAGNDQTNALAWPISPQVSVRVETEIDNPPAGTGAFEQGGLWFGNGEDDYIKVVFMSVPGGYRVQTRYEASGTAVTTRNVNFAALPTTIELRLDANHQTLTAQGQYRVNGGAWLNIGAAITGLPNSLFTVDQAGTTTDTFAGILTSDRTGPQVVFGFDRFDVAFLDTGPGGGGPVAFEAVETQVNYKPTSMTWFGNRLYVLDAGGVIHRYTVNANGTLTNHELYNRLPAPVGGVYTALGMAIEPGSNVDNPHVWISTSITGGDNFLEGVANSSTVWRLPDLATGSGATAMITGLPRAYENHAINSIRFYDGLLYIAQGGNTGAGEGNDQPGSAFGTRAEQPLAAAWLSADVLPATNWSPSQDGDCATAVDDGPPPTASKVIPATCSVDLVATGLRNMYDFVQHSNGNYYGADNGLGVVGTVPETYQPDCQGYIAAPEEDYEDYDPGAQPDSLHLLQPGSYYGHPNPSRDECVFFDGTFQSQLHGVTVSPLPNFQSALQVLNTANGVAPRSLNSIMEYDTSGSAFAGQYDGDLFITAFAGLQGLYHYDLAETCNNSQSAYSNGCLDQVTISYPAGEGIASDAFLGVTQIDGGRVVVGDWNSRTNATSHIVVLTPDD